MSAERYATIDIGTNSVLLLAAQRTADGRFEPLAERMEITRLGRGVDQTGVLSDEALADTLEAVGRFADEARALGCREVAATATSAARDAANGHRLIEGAEKLGVPVEIIAGEREARLSFAAVAADFAEPGKQLAVIDIGGGSTEICLGDADGLSFRHSFDVGSVRLTERHVRGDPPMAESISELEAALRRALADVPKAPAGTRVVGIAGTFTTLASVALALDPYDAARVHGFALSLEELDALGRRLASMPLQERRTLPGLHPKRADVIVAGALLAAECVRALGAGRVTIGDRGVRWGYLYERFGAR